MKEPAPHIQSALESISAIESYRPETQDEFLSDSKTRDAVLMRLQDVGENLARIRQHFPEFWNAHESEGWNDAIGVRNIISHGYLRVDLDAVWTIISVDLDGLAASLRASLD